MFSLKPLVLLALASSVLAQATPPAKPDFSTATPVASPNRIQLSSLSKTMTSTKASSTTVSAVTVVDSTGKTVGRALSNTDVLVPYNGQLMHAFVYGLSDTLDWGSFFAQVYYSSSDCSGVPLMHSGLGGTRYIGNRMTDQSGTVMGIIDTSTATQQTIGSLGFFDGGANQCYAWWGQALLAPMFTVPLSTFGTPPMVFK